jgi:hypothetical protein
VCHVVKAEAEGRLLGFISHFGCHPVVCCSESRLIHGDFCGVATNRIEREHPGCVGLFLQGAQGDVNTCVVHRSSQEESLRGLDVLAERYARSVRLALDAARPVAVDRLRCELREAVFRRRPWDLDFLRAMLAEKEAVLAAADASDDAQPVRMATVYAIALRGLIAQREAGRSLEPATEVQGLRIGPIELLASPFEIFQAIKNEVVGQANAPVPWVVGISNDSQGYAPDRNTTPRHAYAADVVPLMCGCVPFADIHTELSRELLALDDALSR